MFTVSLNQPSFLASNTKKNPPKGEVPIFSTKIVATQTRTENRGPCSSAKKMASLYEVLGIPTGASCIEVKAAYRKLARTCHPDVVSMNQKESSANQFMMIHLAYSTLSDPDKRAQYDREIYGCNKRSANIVSMPGRNQNFSYAGRKWETDQCW